MRPLTGTIVPAPAAQACPECLCFYRVKTF